MKKAEQKNNKFKKVRKIIKWILLGILAVIIILAGYLFINKKLIEANDKRIINAMNKLEKEKLEYVFVDINPSFVITIKNNKVQDVACLNDDCLSFYDEIDIKNKNTNDSIDILYNLTNEKGFDVSDGVNVKTTFELEIKNSDYINIEKIDETTKNELLEKIKNKDAIKNNNDNYYTKLWNELKKDNDYGTVYECEMISSELTCYFSDKFNMDYEDTVSGWTKIINNVNSLKRVLDKFGIEYIEEGNEEAKVISEIFGIDFIDVIGIIVNGKKYDLFGEIEIGSFSDGGIYWECDDPLATQESRPDCLKQREPTEIPGKIFGTDLSFYSNVEELYLYKGGINLITKTFYPKQITDLELLESLKKN